MIEKLTFPLAENLLNPLMLSLLQVLGRAVLDVVGLGLRETNMTEFVLTFLSIMDLSKLTRGGGYLRHCISLSVA